MKVLKTALKITGITLLVLLLLAFIVPVVFKKQVQALVKKEINKSLDATVEFSDVKLSLFRHFPKVGILVKDLVIINPNGFANDTLVVTEKVDASAGLFSILKGKDIKVSSLHFTSPRIHALVDSNGRANWDIARKSPKNTDPSDTSASVFQLTLKHYEINDGYLYFRDENANSYAELENFDHMGSGNLTADVFTLATSTEAESASFSQDDIPYLINTRADIDAAIKIDNTTNTYTFDTKDILLNNLQLSTAGFVQMINDSVFNMDIKFSSPSNDFKDILSMVPDMFKNDFSDLKTSGKASFNGFVKGTLTPDKTPAYDVNLEVKDGSFQYPDLPKPIKHINLTLRASNPDGKPDNAVIDIPKGHLEMDNEPFDFRFIYKKPKSTQLIDAAAKGKVDLSQLSRFIKLRNGTKISGLVWADAFIKGPMKAIQELSGNFTAGGFFDIRNLFYSSNDFPQPIKNGNLKATLENTGGIADNTSINISTGHIEVGNDPIDFALRLNKPFSTIDFSGNAKGRFTLDNAKQFTKFPAGTSLGGVLNADLQLSGNKAIIINGEYDKLNLLGTANLQNMHYINSEYPSGVKIANANFDFKPASVGVPVFNGNYMGSNFSGSGTLNNLVGFIANKGTLSGNLNASLDKMDLNDWTGKNELANAAAATTTTTAASYSPEPFQVPAEMNVSVNAKAGRVTYDKVNYDNIAGTLLFKDQTVTLQGVRADALDGTIILNGSYSTKVNKTNPDITLSYDIDDMDVQKAFLSFNPIQAIMPIGKYLSGKLSSELNMSGNLKGNMMPDLQSLTGKGNLLLLQGVLQKFAPLEKIAAALQIDRLKSISVKEIRNYIEFSNGKVLVKPFNLKIEDIEMIIGGRHGFDQSIEYFVEMKVPRKYMGSAGNNLINGLVSDANKKGIPLTLGEKVDLNIKVGGTLNSPSIKIDLAKMAGNVMEELKDQAKDYAKEKLDSAREKIKDTITAKIKDKVLDKIFGKDTTKVKPPVDSPKKKDDPKVKDILKDIWNKKKKDSI
jgi:uncharacterized protein involved in outer membrane biogenesis